MIGRMVFLSMLLSLLSTSTALNTRRALLKHGAAIAAEAIDSGRARAVLERLVAISNRG